MALIRTGSTTWEDNVDPTVNSDSSVGYQTGDYHRNTATGDVFYIKDTAVGAAVWVDADPSAGGGSATLRNVSATTTFATANETVNCTANTFIVNLPTAVGIQGTPYTLVNSGTGIITWKGNFGQTINGSTTIDLAQYTSITVQSDGANWIISYTPTPITTVANATTIVQVTKESDFGTLIGNTRTLAANTTYFIRGIINCTNLLAITNAGTSITGFDRDRDGISYTGANGLGDFITVTDVNTEFLNIKFSSTNSTGGDVVLRASNFNYGAFNDGRSNVLTMINCQFRNCYDVHHIEGFDLVDFQNTLFWYIEATTIGCHFKNVSKLQISSCEYVRWFDETSLPTPLGYALTPLVELVANGLGNGFGAVNISSSIIHPQQTQDGLNISATSTTGFGTISGNTFINVGLTTGAVSNFDYNVQNTYIIQANQGLLNGNAKGTLSIVGNLNNLNTGTTNPQILNEANVGGSFTNTPTFPVATRVTTSVPNCSFIYDNKNNGNFFVVITGTVEMTGDGFIACRVRANGVAIPFAIGYPEIRQGRAQSFSFSVVGSAVVGDVFDVEFEALTTAGVPTLKDILVREFVLNGYQF